MQDVFAKGFQLAFVIASTVDQQNDADVACRETVHQTRQQLKLEILHQDGVTEEQEAARRVFLVLFQGLIERDLRQDLVELLHQVFRVGGAAPLDVVFTFGAQAFFKQAAVVIERLVVVAQDSEIDTAFGQRLQEYFKSQPITGALVDVCHAGSNLGLKSSSKRHSSRISFRQERRAMV